MNMFKKLSAMVVLGLVLGACASLPKQAFNKAANQDVKTIVVLEPAGQTEYEVANLGHAGMGFGLIGGLIAAADIQSKTNRFTALMKEREFTLASEFHSALVSELQNAGYSIKTQALKRPKPAWLENYTALDQEADAYLDTDVRSGYYAASGASDYVPTVRSRVRLVKKATKDVLYQDFIAYGYENRFDRAVSIAAEQKYFFKDFAALEADADRALEGMRHGLPLVAKHIAENLSR